MSVSPIEPALRSQLKIPENEGLLATDVFKDSPAAKAEVKVHDILMKLAGKSLDSQEKLIELVQANGGKTIAIELIREGKTQATEVTPRTKKEWPGPQSGNTGVVRFSSSAPVRLRRSCPWGLPYLQDS